MKPIFWNARGDETERRFLEATSKRSTTPKWFRGVRRTSPSFDAKGIDVQARIKRPDSARVMTIPIQIKSSESGKRSFYENHPEAKQAGVPVLVVTDAMTPHLIREALYDTLKPFLAVEREHFKKYLDGLGRTRLSKRGQKIKEHIARSRE